MTPAVVGCGTSVVRGTVAPVERGAVAPVVSGRVTPVVLPVAVGRSPVRESLAVTVGRRPERRPELRGRTLSLVAPAVSVGRTEAPV